MKKHLTLADVIALLRQRIKEAGSQKLFAERAGISPQYVSDVLNDRREPGDAILKPLGLRRIVNYEQDGAQQ